MNKQDIIEYFKQKVQQKGVMIEKDYISTGATLADIITGGGYRSGSITNFIGNSEAGKTFMAVEAVYQAKKKYKNVNVRYNDAESGFTFDTEALYGFDIREDMVKTPTIQEFAADFGSYAKKFKKNELGIYIVDSFDGLCSDDDIQEYEDRIKKYEEGKEYKQGSYDMSKQKYSSKLFRTICRDLDEFNVALIIISQIRDNIGVTFGRNWTVSGGKALQFYSDNRLFLKSAESFSVVGSDSVNREKGYCLEITGIKTRSKWPHRKCYINLLFDYGVDNISSNIDYLYGLKDDKGKLDTGKCSSISWGENSGEVSDDEIKQFCMDNGWEEYAEKNEIKRYSRKRAMDFIKDNDALYNTFIDSFGVMDRDGLIAYIESNNLEKELEEKTKQKWYTEEEKIASVRKRKTL